VLLLACASPSWAAKLPNDFRVALERSFTPQRSYGVVTQKGVPTTSIYGINGDSTGAHFSIDVIDGEWRQSQGLLDFDQQAVDFLSLGEIVELASISYKDNRVDLRVVSMELHQVSRGDWLSTNRKPEPVATNFKFFLPFPESRVLTPEDLPAVKSYIGSYLKFFPDRDGARAYSARLMAGLDEAAPAVSPAARPSASVTAAPSAPSKREVKTGMTALQVIEVLGKPEKEVTFENSSKWTYPDLTVIFENGRVKEVRF
jgi:hypothetical protein